MIEINSLNKTFGSLQAVNDLTLTVSNGEIYGLVGPDGAGKTTTLRLLVGALNADGGHVIINGIELTKDTEKAREQIGYLSQQFSLYEDLTVMENIRFFAEVRGISRSEWLYRSMEILEFVGLDAFRDRSAGLLSGGMKQKLGLASALVGSPRVLLLDEPTTGVDPVTRQDFWQLLVKLVSTEEFSIENVSVLITTPYMDEATRCNRIGFMQNGKLIAEGSPSQLCSELSNRILEVRSHSLRKLNKVLTSIKGVENVRMMGDRLHVRISSGMSEQVIDLSKRRADQSGMDISSIQQVPASLEDVFILLAGEDHNENFTQAHTFTESHSKALNILLELIPPDKFNWTLSGSANLRMQGLDLTVNDLDIQTDQEEIYKIEKRLGKFMKSPVKVLETGRIRSLAGKAEIDGVEIELIANMQIKTNEGVWQDLVDSEHKTWINWLGQKLPVLALTAEIHIYKNLGRHEKVDQIQEYLINMGNATND